LHGVAVQVQLAGNGAHPPVLGLVQAQDLRAQFRGYGHGWAPPCGWLVEASTTAALVAPCGVTLTLASRGRSAAAVRISAHRGRHFRLIVDGISA